LNVHVLTGSITLLTLSNAALAQEQAVETEQVNPAPLLAPTTQAAPDSTATAPTPPPIAHTASTPPPSSSPRDCPPCEELEDVEGFGEFLLAAGWFDWSKISDRLAGQGYERIPEVSTLIGGEGRAIFGSGFVVGARGAAILTPDGDGPGDFTRSFGGGFGMVDLGFALVHTRSFLLTTTAGIGGYGVSIDISEESSVPFDDALNDPERSVSLGTGGVLGALTLAFDGRVAVGSAERGRQGYFTLGARVGGMYGPPMGEWSLSTDRSATSAPSQSLLGAYTGVAIGFGGGKALAE
jgi:hypothetical protein